MRLYRIEYMCPSRPAHGQTHWIETDGTPLRPVIDGVGRPTDKWEWRTRGGLRERTRLALGRCCTVAVHEVPAREPVEGSYMSCST